jgi:hypothetical protein
MLGQVILQYWSQFHQHFANFRAPIKSLTFTSSKKKLRAKLSYEKAARKMLVKLTPGGLFSQ